MPGVPCERSQTQEATYYSKHVKLTAGEFDMLALQVLIHDTQEKVKLVTGRGQWLPGAGRGGWRVVWKVEGKLQNHRRKCFE